MADLPFDLGIDLAGRLARSLDVEGKIPRALDTLGALAGNDVVLLDSQGGIRAGQFTALGACVTMLDRTAPVAAPATGNPPIGGDGGTPVAVAAASAPARVAIAPARVAIAPARVAIAPARVVIATPLRNGDRPPFDLPDGSADVVVGLWSNFREDAPAEAAAADRLLRPGGRLLIVHDYGRDDVSQLRPADLPEYTTWGRRDGWFLRSGFKVRVVHCWWTFDDMDDATDFLGAAFGDAGRTFAGSMKRPRLSYNVAIYHRTKGAPRM